MYTLFLFCAVIAGTIFLVQFVLLLLGMGFDGADLDIDLPGGDAGGLLDPDTGMVDHGSSFMFGVISVRTLVAAVMMFGLVGMAALSAMEPSTRANIYALVLAVLGGAGAMFGVHFVMRTLYKLGSDGKLRIHNALGRTATVYVPIPAENKGRGKIQIRMQGRLAELAATTSAAQKLATGTAVKVVGIVAASTVEVAPLHEQPKTEQAASPTLSGN